MERQKNIASRPFSSPAPKINAGMSKPVVQTAQHQQSSSSNSSTTYNDHQLQSIYSTINGSSNDFHITVEASQEGRQQLPASVPIYTGIDGGDLDYDYDIDYQYHNQDNHQYQNCKVNEVDADAGVTLSNPWLLKSPDEIYDIFLIKGNKLGIIANRLLNILVKEGYIPSTSKKETLAKKKEDQKKQRSQFSNLPPGGVKLVRDFMFANNISISGNNHIVLLGETGDSDNDVGHLSGLAAHEISLNLQARIVHLADDANSMALLIHIFGGNSMVNKKERRELLDDKNMRCNKLWERLAIEFVNNSEWTPVNEQEDYRLKHISTELPPSIAITPHALRKLWSDLRTHYSTCCFNYHSSGNGIEGDGDGDDEFFNSFARGNLIYFYMHKLFKGQPPVFLTRDMPTEVQSDVGASQSSALGKRQPLDVQSPMIDLTSSEAEITRDENAAVYYKVTSMQSVLESSSFHETFQEDEKTRMKESYRKDALNIFLD